MQVIPAVDVLDGEVVRLTRGSYDDVTRYGPDPAGRLESWGALGASLVHVVDLGAARSGHRDEKLTRALARSGVPFQVVDGYDAGMMTAQDVAWTMNDANSITNPESIHGQAGDFAGLWGAWTAVDDRRPATEGPDPRSREAQPQ